MMCLINIFKIVMCLICLNNIKALDVTFRDVEVEDLANLNTLMRSSKEAAGGDGYTKEYLDDFMNKLSFTSETLQISKAKVLLVNKRLAGFYSFYINSNDLLELDNFFLAPDYLYKGYGKILWNHGLNTAREYSNRDYFIIWSSLEAESFYLKRGCTRIGEKPSIVDPNRVQPILKCVFRSHL